MLLVSEPEPVAKGMLSTNLNELARKRLVEAGGLA
jgi:hypothetical protein